MYKDTKNQRYTQIFKAQVQDRSAIGCQVQTLIIYT